AGAGRPVASPSLGVDRPGATIRWSVRAGGADTLEEPLAEDPASRLWTMADLVTPMAVRAAARDRRAHRGRPYTAAERSRRPLGLMPAPSIGFCATSWV